MKNRTVIIILVTAALLFGFIVSIERTMLTTSDREARRNRVFTELRREFVTRISIARKGYDGIVLEKQAQIESIGEDQWQIVQPKTARASNSEVRALLLAVDYLLRLRTISETGAIEKPVYGLTDPRFEVSFTSRGVTTTFYVGGDTKDQKLYLAIEGVADEFYVVERDILDAVDKGVDAFRDPHLFEETFANALAFEILRDNLQLSFKRDMASGPWRVEKAGLWVLAAPSQVSEFLRQLGDLKAHAFIADNIDETQFEEYGLIEPLYSINVHQKNANVEFRIGAACADNQNHHYATVSGSGMVTCVSDDIMPVFNRPADRYVEKKPLVARKEEVERIVVSRGGKTLGIVKDRAGWHADDPLKTPLNTDTVGDLLISLFDHKTTALKTGPLPATETGPQLASVQVSMLGQEKPLGLLFFGPAQDDKIYIKRQDEEAHLIASRAVMDPIHADLLMYRQRTITQGDKDAIVQLEIKGPVSQTLRKKDGQWQLLAPRELPADGHAARSIAALIASLDVEAYVPREKQSPDHFGTPLATIEAQFIVEEEHQGHLDRTGSRTVILELGTRTKTGTRHGRFSQQPEVVFELSNTLEEMIAGPMIARNLMQIDAAQIVELTLTNKGRSLGFTRAGSTWGSKDSQAFDRNRLQQLVADLGVVKTVNAVAFKVDPDLFQKPTLTITGATEAQAADGQNTTLIIGPRAQDGSGYLSYNTDIEAMFIVPGRMVEELIDFASAVQ